MQSRAHENYEDAYTIAQALAEAFFWWEPVVNCASHIDFAVKMLRLSRSLAFDFQSFDGYSVLEVEAVLVRVVLGLGAFSPLTAMQIIIWLISDATTFPFFARPARKLGRLMWGTL